MKLKLFEGMLFGAIVCCVVCISCSQKSEKASYRVLSFGEGGQHKMTYDRRQRPQAVLMGDDIHIVYNGGAPVETKKPTPTMPFAITYNLKTGRFSESVQLPEKFYNPLYKRSVGTLKTNLYYVKVDLETHKVTNFEGEEMETPIVLEKANAQCKIWDTNWRGAGVPPDILIDKNDNPAFLHLLTEEVPEELNYYYVRWVNNKWEQTVIAPACHKWNSSQLMMDDEGILYAYLLMDEGYFNSKGKGTMNNHGGGTHIEEWISSDVGNTWAKKRTLFSADNEYAGWRFNNVQPIKTKEGKIKEGVWLFYGWKDNNAPKAKAFLLFEDTFHDPSGGA